jgi:hypothetical protein
MQKPVGEGMWEGQDQDGWMKSTSMPVVELRMMMMENTRLLFFYTFKTLSIPWNEIFIPAIRRFIVLFFHQVFYWCLRVFTMFKSVAFIYLLLTHEGKKVTIPHKY